VRVIASRLLPTCALLFRSRVYPRPVHAAAPSFETPAMRAPHDEAGRDRDSFPVSAPPQLRQIIIENLSPPVQIQLS
jgi:hypothetical protein